MPGAGAPAVALSRALAAAEKRLWLLPNDRCVTQWCLLRIAMLCVCVGGGVMPLARRAPSSTLGVLLAGRARVCVCLLCPASRSSSWLDCQRPQRPLGTFPPLSHPSYCTASLHGWNAPTPTPAPTSNPQPRTCSEAQLQYGLLQYFSRRYDDAWIELALYMERFAQPQQAAGASAAAAGTHTATATPLDAGNLHTSTAAVGGGAATPAGADGGEGNDEDSGVAAADAPAASQQARHEERVRVLLERIRLQLEYAGARS